MLEELIGRNPLGLGEHPNLGRRGSGFFTRSNTSEFTNQSDESDSISNHRGGAPSRKIALAKEILAEATHCYSNLGGGLRSTPPGGSGSVGPLLSMLDQAGSNSEKVCACLDTLGFLMQDRASCRTAEALDGIGIILGVLKNFHSDQDRSILASALACLEALVKNDDQDKVRGKIRLQSYWSPTNPVSNL